MGSFSALHWIIFGALAWLVFSIFKSAKGSGSDSFCKACGHSGPSKTVVRGSIWLELILWLCFLIPGFIYSVWRLTGKTSACTECGSHDLVPPNSPVALAIKRQIEL